MYQKMVAGEGLGCLLLKKKLLLFRIQKTHTFLSHSHMLHAQVKTLRAKRKKAKKSEGEARERNGSLDEFKYASSQRA